MRAPPNKLRVSVERRIIDASHPAPGCEGNATGYLGGAGGASAVRRLEAALRSSGMPKSEAMRLISEFKSGLGDPAGRGEGDPTERGHPADISGTAAMAASLTTIIQR